MGVYAANEDWSLQLHRHQVKLSPHHPGGILALAGVAFESAGPGALLAFVFNGVIAVITVLSFAEMSTAFPQSGGTYAFAKRVLSVQAAFMVGWVVWFASIVAAVLYALGFAAYFQVLFRDLFGRPPFWLAGRPLEVVGAVMAVLFYARALSRSGGGGTPWATVGKMAVFAVLVAGGLPALVKAPGGSLQNALDPLLPFGMTGVLAAMGFSFIAFQGFDLIAAVAGDIKEPRRTIPRAMLLSIGLALAVYLPLLFIIATVGVSEGSTIGQMSAASPETVVAIAAQNYLGQAGYWLVVVAALLSMLSALEANLLAASNVVLAMARDRTLPPQLAALDPFRQTPVAGLRASAATVAFLIAVLPGVAEAGAAASLIFLISFALTHWMAILVRRRAQGSLDCFEIPWFPYLPAFGALCCLGLALFQAVNVPAAGAITALWLTLGGALYLALFERRARVADAAAEGSDPSLMVLRGRSPVMLVPVANPEHAPSMVAVARALTPDRVGRVLLLGVAASPNHHLEDAQEALRRALQAETSCEALVTIAESPWEEIHRIFTLYRCESLLVGLSQLEHLEYETHLEDLATRVASDVVVLRAPVGWQPGTVKRILVPVAGSGGHDVLRARFLNSLLRGSPELSVTYLHMAASEERVRQVEETLKALIHDEVGDRAEVRVEVVGDVVGDLVAMAQDYDLIVLGLQRQGKQHAFGRVTLEVAGRTEKALIVIGHRARSGG